ncbi:Protein of unknown function [Butyrivibrio fibrisolvens DSM 3071]|uniref:DUF3160 domain-containing protein n=1 Tax=Butyrivibrio fibrisolvens DSM 3071 TaxID=1121131 RepID=A0A1M6BJ46_BUTFI|nr:DUF3160 domain-containing protein [Butyrivibrio fibrisolvens]SHI48752.1 Protein of unknown function [Butyrivibrio fibrisolvens DSM 3071]
MKKNLKKTGAVLLATSLVIQAAGCADINLGKSSDDASSKDSAESETSSNAQEASTKDATTAATTSSNTTTVSVESLERTNMLNGLFSEETVEYTVKADGLVPESDLSNVANIEDYSYYSEDFLTALATDGFVISPYNTGYEFFDSYEMNRYLQKCNFVTVDSMMHTYHLYFTYLLKKTEKEYLSSELAELGKEMLDASKEQYEALKGTDWENAALLNVAYFAVGASLLDDSTDVPDYVADNVKSELSLINNAAGITSSPIFGFDEDYSQYKPRGYYDQDEDLKPYFRAMMWYGRINYDTSEDDLLKASVLMTTAMQQGPITRWEKIYTVTAFFAGEADDLSYYEYQPAIASSFADASDVTAIASDSDGYASFKALVDAMEGPSINSTITMDDGGATDHVAESKGFRFIGQRFSLDAAIFQNLIYSKTKENSEGETRNLPDALDVPAALGSEKAMELLEEQGDTDYENYTENMEKLQGVISAKDDTFWEASLSSAWLKTLTPLLSEKTSEHPYFMQSDKWAIKDIEGFLASWTELKHDTVLYAKQPVAEMGGDDIEKDDRGYVEPEPDVYTGLKNLINKTSEGLDAYGYISDTEKENLALLSELADNLSTISVKELAGETLTDDEYELIRGYGGSLEHFWHDAVVSPDDESPSPDEYPSALVTDVATDPNGGEYLECATGGTATIYVIAPVDGQLKICEGEVFAFYEFAYSERLTDSEWRLGMGFEHEYDPETYGYVEHEPLGIERPWWAEQLRTSTW